MGQSPLRLRLSALKTVEYEEKSELSKGADVAILKSTRWAVKDVS